MLGLRDVQENNHIGVAEDVLEDDANSAEVEND
jgi:hypothetical protein